MVKGDAGSSGELIVCVDGGLSHCLAAGLTPDWLVGDLDSVPQHHLDAIEGASVERYSFPPEKDASDLQLALQLLADAEIDEVFLHGVSGGRTDHHLFNWLLPLHRTWPFVMHYEDAWTRATVVRPGQAFRVTLDAPTSFSVLPLCDARGVTVSGARYPLDDALLRPGDTLGLSNEIDCGTLEVHVIAGVLLVLINKVAS